MSWAAYKIYPAYFMGGAFFGNFIPHFVQGASGRKFPSPFSKPPGMGLSSSLVNVLWGSANLVASYFLILKVGEFDVQNLSHVGAVGLGILLIGVQLATHFGKLDFPKLEKQDKDNK